MVGSDYIQPLCRIPRFVKASGKQLNISHFAQITGIAIFVGRFMGEQMLDRLGLVAEVPNLPLLFGVFPNLRNRRGLTIIRHAKQVTDGLLNLINDFAAGWRGRKCLKHIILRAYVTGLTKRRVPPYIWDIINDL